MRRSFLSLLLLTISFITFSQNKIVAFKLVSKTYNTLKLNVNGVALKSVTIIGDETAIRNAMFKNGGIYFSNWFGNTCNFALMSMDDIMKEYPAANYKHFDVEQSRIYIIIDNANDFIKTYNSFSINKIPPPTPPSPPNKSQSPKSQYKHVDFCEPDTDKCVTLCTKKTEASYEVCCDNFCGVVKFDGELKLAVEIEK